MHKKAYKRKRVMVFAYEGKNNKTESIYFSHFKPKNDDYIIKHFSCGVTDPINMIRSAKEKRKDLDYKPKEDLTFIFIDCDCDSKKDELIEELRAKQSKDTIIIKTNPCFELWFLNHFCLITKEFRDNKELLDYLSKFIPSYSKSKDYFDILKANTNLAIKNSNTQLCKKECKSKTEVVTLINNQITFK